MLSKPVYNSSAKILIYSGEKQRFPANLFLNYLHMKILRDFLLQIYYLTPKSHYFYNKIQQLKGLI